MVTLLWIRGLLLRQPARLAGAVLGIAVAVALLTSIGTFLSASKATMTQRTVADVPVDWQVEVQPGAAADDVLSRVRQAPTVQSAMRVEFARATGLQATTGGTTQSTGPGMVVGLPDGYAGTFPGAVRLLSGDTSGVVAAQQTAANLHLTPGDSVLIGRAGLPDAPVTITGVVELLTADTLFQKVGAPPGSGPSAPPDNVLLTGSAQWHDVFDPLVAIPEQTTTQIHAKVSHDLAADPAQAFTQVTGQAKNLEVVLAGTGVVGNNVGAALDAARGDALYAQVIFLFLGLPGAVLAAMLTVALAATGADRRLADQSLLRARGATTSQLVRLAGAEGLIVGGLGAALGLAAAIGIGRVGFGTVRFGSTARATATYAAVMAVVGLTIATISIVLPAWRCARNATVTSGRQAVGQHRRPWWMRYGVDVMVLALSGLTFWITSRNGYKLILVPEGIPTISVDYWAFAGPALLWIGSGLMAWRLSEWFLARTSTARLLALPFAHQLAPTVAASMRRQRRLLSRSLVLVALTISFAASTAVFNATYRQQGAVDAALTNGADVTVTESPGADTGPAVGDRLGSISGVRHVEPLQHRFAYVGADLQDLYGVRPTSVVDAGRLQDAYFAGGSAKDLMAKLAAQPDGILVSQETVKDFQLLPGDQLTLRLQDGRTKQLSDVAFHYIGIAREFPTAPKDSFLVANAEYVARSTGSEAVGAFLVDTGGNNPRHIAEEVRSIVGTQAVVTDVVTSRQVVGSSLTAVDLTGLTKVELGFALVLAAASTGLVLALGIAERRRTFVIVRSLGADASQLRSFVITEALFVTVGGALAGIVGAWALSYMLVKVLTGVFDPAPEHLAIPWTYLVALTAATTAATALVVVAAATVIRRTPLAVLRGN